MASGDPEELKQEIFSRLRQITGDTIVRSKEANVDTGALSAVRELVDKLAVAEDDEKLAAELIPGNKLRQEWMRPSFSVLERLTLPTRPGVGGVEPVAFPTAATVAVAIAVVVAFRPGAATQDELRRGLLDRLSDEERETLADQLTALRKDPEIIARVLGSRAIGIAELTGGQLEATASMLTEYGKATK